MGTPLQASKPEVLNPKPLNPKPENTLNPKPENTLNFIVPHILGNSTASLWRSPGSWSKGSLGVAVGFALPYFANLGFTHRPLSSSFLWWLIFRILQGNPKKEPLRGLWVRFWGLGVWGLGLGDLGV